MIKSQQIRHFIDLDKIDPFDLKLIIESAKKLKSLNPAEAAKLLPLKNLAMIFEKTSTRTRVSFEVGINQLGGNAIVMNKSDMQLGKGESVPDTAKVLSRFVDMIMIRCKDHQLLLEMAENSSCPVINGLSDYSHPCQILASILTIEECSGPIANKTLAWFGDANNVLISYIQTAKAFDYTLNIAVPKELDFCNAEIKKAQKNGARINLYHNAVQAAQNADIIITDTWISMGEQSEKDQKIREKKLQLLAPFQVNSDLMKIANQGAIFTHCLPAYRGFEVSAEVIDGKQSVVFEEAENRLHAQKAIMLWLMQITI